MVSPTTILESPVLKVASWPSPLTSAKLPPSSPAYSPLEARVKAIMPMILERERHTEWNRDEDRNGSEPEALQEG